MSKAIPPAGIIASLYHPRVPSLTVDLGSMRNLSQELDRTLVVSQVLRLPVR